MPRPRSLGPRAQRTAIACAIALLAAPIVLARGEQTPSSTVDRLRAGGSLRLGYRTDARPFAYRDESGQPAGYSVELCQRIADAIKSQAGASTVTVEWVPLTVDERFRAVQQRQVDLLCGAETITLARRAEVSFSIPVFPGGVGALVRADSPVRLREVLSGQGQIFRPTWRAAATQVLQSRAFSAVQGTTAEKWLGERMRDLRVIADVTRVNGYDAGIQGLLDRRSDAFFGERAVLLDTVKRHTAGRDLLVIDRLFTYESLALVVARGDDEFRLFVDRALSRIYTSGDIGGLYTKWFGEPDQDALTFFRWNTVPE